MNKPFVSILVPVFNVEKYIHQCLDSIISQSYKNFEVILVDDASPDNCPQICDEYCIKYENFRVIHLEQNKGLLNARDVALKAASGDYILWVDSDDYIGKDRLLKLVTPVIDYGVDVVVGAYTRFVEKNNKSKKIHDSFEYGYYSKEKYALCKESVLSFNKKHNRNISPNVWSKLWKKELFLPLIGKLPEELKIGEDSIRSYYALLNANSIFVLDDYEHYYRITPNQMSGAKYHNDYFKYALWIYTTLLSYNFSEQVNNSIYENIAHISISAVLNEGYNEDKSKSIFNIEEICGNIYTHNSLNKKVLNKQIMPYKLLGSYMESKKIKLLYSLSKICKYCRIS